MDKIQILVYFAIYFLGRFRFSVVWMVLLVLVSIYGYEKSKRIYSNTPASPSDERDAIFLTLQDNIPSWILFPDVERAEWINNVLSILWPRIKDYSEQKLRSLQSTINKQPWLKNLKINQVDMGQVTPRITGVKYYSRNVLREEIVVDFNISYSGDFILTMSIFGFEGGIRNIQLEGCARITLKNFVSKPPFISGVEFSFLSCPKFNYELLPIFASQNMHMFSNYIRSTIEHQILNHVVFPHKIYIKLKTNQKTDAARSFSDEDIMPDIDGVIRLEVKNISKFVGFDNQKAYINLELGPQVVESKKAVIEAGTAEFNFACELIQFSGAIKRIMLSLHIRDESGEITKLRGFADTKNLSKEKKIFEKCRLAPSGRVPITLTWLELSPHKKDLTINGNNNAVLLELYVDSARRLPTNQTGVFVELSIGKSTQQTWASDDNQPSWRKYFTFFFHHPEKEALTIKLIHQATGDTFGQFVYSMSDLIDRRSMRHKLQAFPLLQTAHDCEILMSLKLNALRKTN